MGYYVHLSVIFSCDENEGVAELAKRHMALLPEDGPSEAKWFLEDLSKRQGQNIGPKGGLSLWGLVGNYTQAEEFVEVLRPFWNDLLNEVDGGPLGFEHVLVFYEPEQSEAASAIEIFRERSDDSSRYEKGDLLIRHHRDLPFCWGQM